MEQLVSGAAGLGLDLTPGQIEQFEAYVRELLDWNRRLNLTAITGYEDIQVSHFLDALTVVLAWRPEGAGPHARVLDIGTGAGIPGIPLKIIFAQVHLVLLETTAKKAVFLRHLVTELSLDGVDIVTGRAEEAARDPQYRGSFDLVLSRAVGALPVLAELTLPFCKVGGQAILHKKGDIAAELAAAARAIGTLGGSLREVRRVDIPELPDDRCLVVIDKVASTPERYPRRPGTPKKRPL